MNKELIINSASEEVDIALLEDKKLVELHSEKSNLRFGVGDIYLGKVRKIIPGLNAAFIDVGYKRDAFLHYSDLSPFINSILKFTHQAVNSNGQELDFSKFKIEPEIIKSGKISDVLKGKPEILVQILKEPIASKGPRLTCELSFPGRYVVITPFNDVVAVSKKIQSSEERKRLKEIATSFKPKNFGVIIRTAAEGKSATELQNDLLDLVATWDQIKKNMKGALPPARVMTEEDKTHSILRDLLNEDFNKIVVNDKSVFEDTKVYLKKIAPEKSNILSLHKNDSPIFDTFGISRQIKAAFGKTVNLPSGAYLIVEHTEALHVIDVNSGYKSVSNNQEENALETNLEAAEEIARQLRLRDMGGIIVVDFIDMKLPDNRRHLTKHMKEMMKNDRAKHSVLPITKFGLMQITRQRMRPAMDINTTEVCPSCQGTGKVSSTLILKDEIEKNLKYLFSQQHKKLTIEVNPIIHAYLTKGFPSIRMGWSWKYKQKVKVVANPDNQMIEYNFIDKNGEQIKL